MLEHRPGVGEPSFACRDPRQRGHRRLVDQMPQERRLGQDLKVQEPRPRLQRDHRERLPTMKLARRMKVQKRHREDDPPRPRPQPANGRVGATGRPAADHMVRMIDGLQERLQVCHGPGLAGGRDQHQGQLRIGQSPDDRITHRRRPTHEFESDGPAQRPDQLREPLPDRFLAGIPAHELHDQHARPRSRFALEMAFKRIIKYRAQFGALPGTDGGGGQPARKRSTRAR